METRGYEIRAKQGETVIGERIVFATEAAAYTALDAAFGAAGGASFSVVATDDAPERDYWDVRGLAAAIVEGWIDAADAMRGETAEALADARRSDVPTGEDRDWAEEQIGRPLTDDDEWSDLIRQVRAYAAEAAREAL